MSLNHKIKLAAKIKLNNNPENLCIMSASDHAKIHNLGDKGNGQRLKSM